MGLKSLLVLSSTILTAVLANSLIGRTDTKSDTCGQVDSELKVPQPLFPNNLISTGSIHACLCDTEVPQFIETNAVAIAGVALAGKTYVISAITDMVNKVGQKCSYPTHASPVCKKDYPCGFDCKDGYTPYPSTKPSQCVCNLPLKECNGKCGDYKSCPSGIPHYKRDTILGGSQCPMGLTACGIWGRSAKTWECIDTTSDLESCGGCMIPLGRGSSEPEGLDCTALPGVSDVSCIRGRCIVHRCTAGYDLHPDETSCLYNEDRDPVILAAQYGLEHVPLQ